MTEKTTPLYVICSARRSVGKTLVSRLLAEFYAASCRSVTAFDLADEGPQLANYLPHITTIVDIADTRGQMSFFDRLITDTPGAKIIDLSHRAFSNFFNIVRDICFFEEALRRSIEPLILFIDDPHPDSARIYAMLRRQCSASFIPVHNCVEERTISRPDAPPSEPASLHIPLLGLSLRALVDQQSFSFSEFWRTQPFDLPMSADEELSSWVERVFFQFRDLEAFLEWDDPSAVNTLIRSHHARVSGQEAHSPGAHSGQNFALTSLDRDSLVASEQLLRFAPKKVRNIGSFHPARIALRTAIAELEVAQARQDHAMQAERQARELHIASERMLAAIADEVPVRGKSLSYNLELRRAARDKSRKHVATTKAIHKSLSVNLSDAENAVRESMQHVISAAIDVITAEAFRQANGLEASWKNVWRQYDRLSALADCRLQYGEGMHSVRLPPEIVKLMQTIGALDLRQFSDGRNHLAACAGELWCRWFKELLTNPETESAFERKD